MSQTNKKIRVVANLPLRWYQIADYCALFLKLVDGGFDPGFAEFVERKILQDFDLPSIGAYGKGTNESLLDSVAAIECD